MRSITSYVDRRVLYSLCLAFSWLLMMRVALFLHSGVWPETGPMLLSDLTGSILLVLLLYLFSGRIWRIPFIAILGFTFFSAGEHLLTHETLFRIIHSRAVLEPVFLASSFLQPRLFILPVYCLFVWGLLRLHEKFVPIRPGINSRMVLAAVVVVAGHLIWALSLSAPSNNVIASVFAQIPASILQLERPPTTPEEADSIADTEMEDMFFHRELAGERSGQNANVLLIMVEGLSAGYLPGISKYHDLDPAVQLRDLETELESQGFRIYRNVLSMQRKTDRGTYAILCGDYPRITAATPKMTEVASGEADPLCLPEILSKAGYKTAYWQAAPLEFMNKDVFMPRSGFEVVKGMESFSRGEDHEGWGPPDGIFFPQVAERIKSMNKESRPWFATLLNVGTHHPFPIEESNRDAESDAPSMTRNERQESRRIAMLEMEKALLDFMEELSRDDILSETIVIITSDESGGFLRMEQPAKPLDGNFGMLGVRPSDRMTLESLIDRDAIVSQLDIALTIVDMAGIDDEKNMMGRSLLVKDSEMERGLMLGDVYSGNQYFLLDRGQLMACGEALIGCTSLEFNPKRLFGTLNPVEEEPFLDLSLRRSLVKRAGLVNPRDDSP